MKNRRFVLIVISIFFALSLFLFIKHSNQLVYKSNAFELMNYSFIYSHPFNKESYLLTTNDGEKFEELTLKARGIFDVEQNYTNEDTVYLIPTHDSLLYEFDVKNQTLDKQNLTAPLTFIIENEDIQIKGLNDTIDSHTLLVDDNKFNTQYSLNFSPYLLEAIYDKNNIYLLNVSVDKIESTLHIINRRNGNVTGSVDILRSSKNLVKYNDYIVITTGQDISIVSTTDYSIRTIKYPDTINASGENLYVYEDNLYVVYGDYRDGSINVLKLNSDFDTVQNHKLETERPFIKAKFENEQLLVLAYNEESTFGGEFTVFNLDSFEKELSISLPKKDIRVQEFIIR